MPALRDLRHGRGLSLQELGDLVGVGWRHIAFIETGDRKPSLDVAIKIAKVFNLPIEDIFVAPHCTKYTRKRKGGQQ